MHASHLGADFIVINASKIYGPKQTAALYAKAGTSLKSLILGGGQERGLRSGTENVAGIIGLAAALDLVQTRRHAEVSRMQTLQRLFFELLAQSIPSATINGSHKSRLPNNVHLTIPGQDNERLMMQLDEQGILCAVGSACSASNEEPSHVLKAMGLSDADAQSSLRFTTGFQTTEADIRATIGALIKFIS
jgi:cysteine desulfurase